MCLLAFWLALYEVFGLVNDAIQTYIDLDNKLHSKDKGEDDDEGISSIELKPKSSITTVGRTDESSLTSEL